MRTHPHLQHQDLQEPQHQIQEQPFLLIKSTQIAKEPTLVMRSLKENKN